MDPLLGVGLGAGIVWLLTRGKDSPSGAKSGNGSMSIGSGGIGSITRPGAPRASQQAAAQSASLGVPLSSLTKSASATNVASKTALPADGLNKNDQRVIADRMTYLGLGQPAVQLGVQALQASGDLAKNLPGVGAVANPLADAGYLAVKVSSEAVKTAGEAVSTGTVNFSRVGTVGGSATGIRSEIGGRISSVGDYLSRFTGAGAIGGSVVGTAALSGFGKASDSQRKQILGRSALAGVQTAASVIPGFGAPISAALSALSKTAPGQKVVAEAGRGLFKGYEAQKDILKGDVSAAFGGNKRKERVQSLLAGAAQTKQLTVNVAGAQAAQATVTQPLTSGWTQIKDPTASGGVRNVFTYYDAQGNKHTM